MIRPATADDIPRIIELGTLLHATSSYSKLAFVPAKAAAFMQALMERDGVVFVAEIDGVVVGGMAGGVVDQWFSDELIAYDFSIFVEPKRRNGLIAIKLMRAFEEWARIKGAKQVHMGIGTDINVEGTSRLYEHMGFRHFGPLFVKEL